VLIAPAGACLVSVAFFLLSFSNIPYRTFPILLTDMDGWLRYLSTES
jgi:hypothetical protein